MAKTEDREPVNGKPQIQRQYEGDGPASDIGGMTREERAEKYRRDMGPQFCADLEIQRSEGVKKFRKNGSVGAIDTKYDRWYDPDEWTNEGVYIGEGPCVKAPRPELDVIAADEARKAEARAAVAETQRKGFTSGAQSVLNVVPPLGAEKFRTRPSEVAVARGKKAVAKKGAGK